MKDLSAILPNGQSFNFWEKPQNYNKTIVVDQKKAGDVQDGTCEHPFKTISQAAEIAEPGNLVLIHAGEYHETVSPRRGGSSPEEMITYEAAEDEEVIIAASEVVTDFTRSTDWRLTNFAQDIDTSSIRIYEHDLDPDMFRGYNPFNAVNILHDRLFIEYEKTDMTTYLNRRGMIFVDGKPMTQVPLYNHMALEENTYWVEANGQKVHFRLAGDEDPADHKIEITVREQCFAPKTPFLSYIKVKGITMKHAATGAPVPQRGAISAYRGHHWVIENCTIDWSNCVGIDVGNECWHHEPGQEQQIGYSVIRGCTIKDVGVCGIAGLFAEELLIEDNLIEGTGWQKMELSWEAGGIKLHNSVNGLTRRNVFKNTLRADHIWYDCGNENNRITGNLFLNGIEQREAIFIECTREGVNLIDNNIFWNVEGRFDPDKIPVEPGSTGWYKTREHDVVNGYAIYGEGTDRLYITHNFIGNCRYGGYYAKPVGFRVSKMDRGGTSRKAVLTNNIFYECGESAITFPTLDNTSDGNLFLSMSGGFLRVMYPEPEVCLDLKTWQEFCGFDQNSQNGWFDIEMDDEKLELSVIPEKKAPNNFRKSIQRAGYIHDPKDLKNVAADPHIVSDFFEEEKAAGNVVPGPFNVLEIGRTYKVDPRKKY